MNFDNILDRVFKIALILVFIALIILTIKAVAGGADPLTNMTGTVWRMSHDYGSDTLYFGSDINTQNSVLCASGDNMGYLIYLHDQYNCGLTNMAYPMQSHIYEFTVDGNTATGEYSYIDSDAGVSLSSPLTGVKTNDHYTEPAWPDNNSGGGGCFIESLI